MLPFSLDPRLDGASLAIGDLPLSAVRLMNDMRFPWLLLVPRRPGLSELTDLDDDDARQLMEEARLASRALQAVFSPDKINVGALGNIVQQLHLHVIARFVSDAAWPGPVWGAGSPAPYPPHAAGSLIDRIAAELAGPA